MVWLLIAIMYDHLMLCMTTHYSWVHGCMDAVNFIDWIKLVIDHQQQCSWQCTIWSIQSINNEPFHTKKWRPTSPLCIPGTPTISTPTLVLCFSNPSKSSLGPHHYPYFLIFSSNHPTTWINSNITKHSHSIATQYLSLDCAVNQKSKCMSQLAQDYGGK